MAENGKNRHKKDNSEKNMVLKTNEKLIIDEYYTNGFNGVKAVLKYRPNITYTTAGAYWSVLQKKDTIKDYKLTKETELAMNNNITANKLVNELISWAMADASDYIDISANDIKNLPPSVRRAIQTIQTKERKYKDRAGKEITEETVNIKLVDKTRALEMLAKYIGLFLLDNEQKKPSINIERLDVQTLNALLTASNKTE